MMSDFVAPESSAPPRCPLCANRTQVVARSVQGYRADLRYDIVRCSFCDTHHSRPLEVPPGLYEAIYAHADDVPGYDRYGQYARRVERSSRPLDTLADSEDMYWFIQDALRRLFPAGATVLEVGSGLGYLTFALSRSGYDARGLDVSEQAVRAARARYGDLYMAADLFEYASSAAGQYDVVVATEVLEHVPDPLRFVQAMERLLKPGGVLLITTPNKSSAPAAWIWEGDAPPVHLWWLSETSMRRIAAAAGMSVEFGDFTGFNRRRIGGLVPQAAPTEATFTARISDAGVPTGAVRRSAKQRVVASMRNALGERTVARLRDALHRRFRRKQTLSARSHLFLSRSASMGAILRRSPDLPSDQAACVDSGS